MQPPETETETETVVDQLKSLATITELMATPKSGGNSPLASQCHTLGLVNVAYALQHVKQA